MNTYLRFSQFIKSHFFPEDKKGSQTYLIVDENVISSACRDMGLEDNKEIFISIKIFMEKDYYNGLSIETVLGVIAIQLYAASNRERTNDHTERTYRPILQEIISCKEADLDKWLIKWQDIFWQTLFDWCDRNNFYLPRVSTKTGKDRYVQYPKKLAQFTLNREGLKRFGNIFIDYNLSVGEDISEDDFWRIIPKENLYKEKILLIRTKKILERKDSNVAVAFSQIYNYYLDWDGSEFIEDTKLKKKSYTTKKKFSIHLAGNGTNPFVTIEARDEYDTKIEELNLCYNLASFIKQYYKFKRENIIVFKQNEEYDNSWDETRYLQQEEKGIAILFYPLPLEYEYLKERTKIKIFPKHSIINITKLDHKFYTTPRFYRLEGGLKIDTNTYLKDALPNLILDNPCKYWINNRYFETSCPVSINLNEYIHEGDNIIHLQKNDSGREKILLTVKRIIREEKVWSNSFNKWIIKKSNTPLWISSSDSDKGIVGLNFADYSSSSNSTLQKTTLRRWLDTYKGIENQEEKNIAIKQLNNLLKP